MQSLSFAKLVATPTDTSWSQVYNAGNLFAVLSLKKEEADTDTSLSAIGKEMFSSLESEFFTLEQKTLQSIKEAIANSTHTIPSNVTASLCMSFFKDNILYVFVFGEGGVLMRRAGKIMPLLENTEDGKIVSASGYLKNNDIVIVQTPQFGKDTPEDAMLAALDLDLPNDIAEALSPGMHEKDDGGQAAIIISYKEGRPQAEEEQEIEEEPRQEKADNFVPAVILDQEPPLRADAIEQSPLPEPIEQFRDEKPVSPKFNLSSFISGITSGLLKNRPGFLKKSSTGMNHRKKLFLSVAVIIFILLIGSIMLSKQKEEDTKNAVLFESIYTPALKDYEDGKAVQSINKIFARDEFLNSQKKLKAAENKFRKGSKEEKQIAELLKKVESELGGGSSAVVKPEQVEIGKNDFLSVVKANSGASFTKDANATYFVTGDAVVSVSNSGAKKNVIENDGDWEAPAGLSNYQGNIYVLDKESGILKFTAGGSGFGKSSYFKTIPSNISNAVSLAIDGSVWVLFKDGSIMKFTSGVSDGFSAKGLAKPLKNPKKIFTDIDTENLYVLDPGNSRIVELTKDGNFENQYVADVLKNAKDFEVSEGDGRILVLSGDKFWEIPL